MIPSLFYLEGVEKTKWEEERTQINYTIKDTEILREKFKSENTTESHINPLYYQRDYRRKR